jgi:hypothetical protein
VREVDLDAVFEQARGVEGDDGPQIAAVGLEVAHRDRIQVEVLRHRQQPRRRRRAGFKPTPIGGNKLTGVVAVGVVVVIAREKEAQKGVHGALLVVASRG